MIGFFNVLITKPKYMTALLRSQVFNDNAITKESLMKATGIVGRDNIFDRMIEYLFTPYYGKSLSEIDGIIKTPVNRKSLNYLRSYIARMMNCLMIPLLLSSVSS